MVQRRLVGCHLNDELERIWKELIVFYIVARGTILEFPEETQKDYEKLSSDSWCPG
jgi:hypothetical protein